jgi:hypothetical protein
LSRHGIIRLAITIRDVGLYITDYLSTGYPAGKDHPELGERFIAAQLAFNWRVENTIKQARRLGASWTI